MSFVLVTEQDVSDEGRAWLTALLEAFVVMYGIPAAKIMLQGVLEREGYAKSAIRIIDSLELS